MTQNSKPKASPSLEDAKDHPRRPKAEPPELADPTDLNFAVMILERCLDDGVFTDYEKTALRTVLKRLDGLEGALTLAVETGNKLGAML